MTRCHLTKLTSFNTGLGTCLRVGTSIDRSEGESGGRGDVSALGLEELSQVGLVGELVIWEQDMNWSPRK
jgi:hypothetical protein